MLLSYILNTDFPYVWFLTVFKEIQKFRRQTAHFPYPLVPKSPLSSQILFQPILSNCTIYIHPAFKEKPQVYWDFLSFGRTTLTFIFIRSKELLLICTCTHTQAFSSPLCHFFWTRASYIPYAIYRKEISKSPSLSPECTDPTQTFVPGSTKH